MKATPAKLACTVVFRAECSLGVESLFPIYGATL